MIADTASPAIRVLSSAVAEDFSSESEFVSRLTAPNSPTPTKSRRGRSEADPASRGGALPKATKAPSKRNARSAAPESSGSTACTISAGRGFKPATSRHSENAVAYTSATHRSASRETDAAEAFRPQEQKRRFRRPERNARHRPERLVEHPTARIGADGRGAHERGRRQHEEPRGNEPSAPAQGHSRKHREQNQEERRLQIVRQLKDLGAHRLRTREQRWGDADRLPSQIRPQPAHEQSERRSRQRFRRRGVVRSTLAVHSHPLSETGRARRAPPRRKRPAARSRQLAIVQNIASRALPVFANSQMRNRTLTHYLTATSRIPHRFRRYPAVRLDVTPAARIKYGRPEPDRERIKKGT